MYQIRFLGPAEKYLKKLRDKSLKGIFRDALNGLTLNPYIGEAKGGDLKGIYGLDVYYFGTNYEIAYRIFEMNEPYVVVYLIGTRENFYKELRRLI